MALVRWDPARELDALQSDMNRLFDAFFPGRLGRAASNGSGRRWVPAMDLVESDDEFRLRVDLPGLTEEDVDVEVKDDVLTISGERKAEHSDRGEGYYRVERAFGRFSRSLELPSGVEAGDIAADFDNGVLEVRIPKPQDAKPTKVPIGAGNGAAREVGAGEGS